MAALATTLAVCRQAPKIRVPGERIVRPYLNLFLYDSVAQNPFRPALRNQTSPSNVSETLHSIKTDSQVPELMNRIEETTEAQEWKQKYENL